MAKIFKVDARKVAESAAVAALTILVSSLFILLPLSFSIFTGKSIWDQYDLKKAYFQIANYSNSDASVAHNTGDIIIVDINGIDGRGQYDSLITNILDAGAAVVGLDIIFSAFNPDDEEDLNLQETVQDPRVVSSCFLRSKADGAYHDILDSYFKPKPGHGFVNLNFTGGGCESFTPYLNVVNSDGTASSMPSFATKIVEKYSPEAHRMLLERNDSTILINFSKNNIFCLSPSAIDSQRDIIRGSIVLLGDRGNDEDTIDMFPTPIGNMVSGVDIHAYTIGTILNGTYIREMSVAGSILIAFLLCLLFIPLLSLLRRNEWVAIFVPLIQALLIILLVLTCYLVFLRFNYYIPVLYPLLSMGFIDLCNNLVLRIREVVNKKTETTCEE